MEKLKKLKLFNKIIIILLIVTSFNFIYPTISQASLGGDLMEPITNLLTSVGDGVVDIIHRYLMGQEQSILHSSSNRWQVFIGILAGIFAIAVALAIPAGLGIPALSMGAVMLIGTGTGIFAYNALPNNRVSLPMYSISPEEIFMGNVSLVDVNFFNPDSNKEVYEQAYTQTKDVTGELITSFMPVEQYGETTSIIEESEFLLRYTKTNTWIDPDSGISYKVKCEYAKTNGIESANYVKFYKTDETGEYTEFDFEAYLKSIGELNFMYMDSSPRNIYLRDLFLIEFGWDELEQEKLYIENYGEKSDEYIVLESSDEKYSYRLVISNYEEDDEARTLYKTYHYTVISGELQTTVAKWYVTLRNIALVASMSILVYVGIRMMLTSIAAEKAKYKNMLFDWLIGVGLIFVMHYIMIFAVNLNEQILSMLSNNVTVPKYQSALQVIDEDGNKNSKLIEILEEYKKMTGTAVEINSEGYVSFETNLMGNARLLLQNNRDESLAYVGYAIMFLVLVFYTVSYLFVYLKRVLYMAFLTILAPLVAMTYPIDKLTDGKAQAFNMWIKEYMMNLLIQPVHLLLYYILVSSAINLATKNVLYSLVAIGFILPAEKLVRKFFGFDKAKTPGFLNGATGAALAMSAVGSLRRFGSSGNGKGEGDSSTQNKDGKIRTKSRSLINVNELNFGGVVDEAAKNEQIRQKQIHKVAVEQLQSRLNELKADGFEKGDSEYDKVQKELALHIGKAKEAEAVKTVQTAQVVQAAQTAKAIQEIEDEEEKKLKFNPGGAIKGVARNFGKGIVRFSGKIPNLAARGFGAATLGAVGMAAGIASGDLNSVLKYTMAGGSAGSALGSGLANRATNAMENLADDMFRGAYGEQYDQYLNQKADKLFFASKENQDFYRAEFGSSYQERMIEAIEYRELGITDNSIIAKAMNLPDKFGGSSRTAKEKLYIAQLASQITSRSELARTSESLLNRNIAVSKVNLIEEGVRIIKEWY